jgi:hypothetical protein
MTSTTYPPLVAYYGVLTDTRHDDYVTSSFDADSIITSLSPVPVIAIKPGEYGGDWIVLVAAPYVLPAEMRDDEYLFDVERVS